MADVERALSRQSPSVQVGLEPVVLGLCELIPHCPVWLMRMAARCAHLHVLVRDDILVVDQPDAAFMLLAHTDHLIAIAHAMRMGLPAKSIDPPCLLASSMEGFTNWIVQSVFSVLTDTPMAPRTRAVDDPVQRICDIVRTAVGVGGHSALRVDKTAEKFFNPVTAMLASIKGPRKNQRERADWSGIKQEEEEEEEEEDVEEEEVKEEDDDPFRISGLFDGAQDLPSLSSLCADVKKDPIRRPVRHPMEFRYHPAFLLRCVAVMLLGNYEHAKDLQTSGHQQRFGFLWEQRVQACKMFALSYADNLRDVLEKVPVSTHVPPRLVKRADNTFAYELPADLPESLRVADELHTEDMLGELHTVTAVRLWLFHYLSAHAPAAELACLDVSSGAFLRAHTTAVDDSLLLRRLHRCQLLAGQAGSNTKRSGDSDHLSVPEHAAAFASTLQHQLRARSVSFVELMQKSVAAPDLWQYLQHLCRDVASAVWEPYRHCAFPYLLAAYNWRFVVLTMLQLDYDGSLGQARRMVTDCIEGADADRFQLLPDSFFRWKAQVGQRPHDAVHASDSSVEHGLEKALYDALPPKMRIPAIIALRIARTVCCATRFVPGIDVGHDEDARGQDAMLMRLFVTFFTGAPDSRRHTSRLVKTVIGPYYPRLFATLCAIAFGMHTQNYTVNCMARDATVNKCASLVELGDGTYKRMADRRVLYCPRCHRISTLVAVQAAATDPLEDDEIKKAEDAFADKRFKENVLVRCAFFGRWARCISRPAVALFVDEINAPVDSLGLSERYFDTYCAHKRTSSSLECRNQLQATVDGVGRVVVIGGNIYHFCTERLCGSILFKRTAEYSHMGPHGYICPICVRHKRLEAAVADIVGRRAVLSERAAARAEAELAEIEREAAEVAKEREAEEREALRIKEAKLEREAAKKARERERRREIKKNGGVPLPKLRDILNQ